MAARESPLGRFDPVLGVRLCRLPKLVPSLAPTRASARARSRLLGPPMLKGNGHSHSRVPSANDKAMDTVNTIAKLGQRLARGSIDLERVYKQTTELIGSNQCPAQLRSWLAQQQIKRKQEQQSEFMHEN